MMGSAVWVGVAGRGRGAAAVVGWREGGWAAAATGRRATGWLGAALGARDAGWAVDAPGAVGTVGGPGVDRPIGLVLVGWLALPAAVLLPRASGPAIGGPDVAGLGLGVSVVGPCGFPAVPTAWPLHSR